MNGTPTGVGQPQVSYPDSIIVGTCGACGGPMVVPQFWASGGSGVEDRPRACCGVCGKVARAKVYPVHGPIVEVE